jgi:hypothetical protein
VLKLQKTSAPVHQLSANMCQVDLGKARPKTTSMNIKTNRFPRDLRETQLQRLSTMLDAPPEWRDDKHDLIFTLRFSCLLTILKKTFKNLNK